MVVGSPSSRAGSRTGIDAARPRSRRSAPPTRARRPNPRTPVPSRPTPRPPGRPRRAVRLPPRDCSRRAASVELDPSTRFARVELTGLREDIQAGLSYEIVLTFEQAGQVTVDAAGRLPRRAAREAAESTGVTARACTAPPRSTRPDRPLRRVRAAVGAVGRPLPVVPGLGDAGADRRHPRGPAQGRGGRAVVARRGASPRSTSRPRGPADRGRGAGPGARRRARAGRGGAAGR